MWNSGPSCVPLLFNKAIPPWHQPIFCSDNCNYHLWSTSNSMWRSLFSLLNRWDALQTFFFKDTAFFLLWKLSEFRASKGWISIVVTPHWIIWNVPSMGSCTLALLYLKFHKAQQFQLDTKGLEAKIWHWFDISALLISPAVNCRIKHINPIDLCTSVFHKPDVDRMERIGNTSYPNWC